MSMCVCVCVCVGVGVGVEVGVLEDAFGVKNRKTNNITPHYY